MSGDEGLRALAEAATPGPWEAYRLGNPAGPFGVVAGGLEDRMDDVFDADASREDATFTAAANPTAVLGLLDRLAAAEEAVERVRALADEWVELVGGYVDPSDGSIAYARALGRCAIRVRAAIDGTA